MREKMKRLSIGSRSPACWLTASTFFALSALSPTFAQEAHAVHGLKTPSENIYCMVEDWGAQSKRASLRYRQNEHCTTATAPRLHQLGRLGQGFYGSGQRTKRTHMQHRYSVGIGCSCPAV